MLAVDFVNVLETLAGASGGGAVTSAATRPVVLTKEVASDMVPLRGGNRIQVTSEREPGKLLASEQIKKFLAQRGGADEGGSDELATGVLLYLTSVFHGAHPQSSMSTRNSRELRTVAGMHRCLARR